MPTFALHPSEAKPGMWLLSVDDSSNVADPDLADNEIYLLSRDDLRELYARLHGALYPLKPEPENQFTVG